MIDLYNEFGQNLRMKTILVGYGYEDESALLALKPDGYVQSSTDLQTYIFNLLRD
jgi:phosphoglycolate phosphatase-like HAD superfamily hydrolase